MAKPKTVEDIGHLGTGIYLTQHAGKASYLGHDLNLSTTLGRGEPVIYANKKTFRLSWEDIIWIAEQRGMFSPPSESKVV